MKRRTYTPEFKRSTAEKFLAAENKGSFAREVGVDPAVIRRWATQQPPPGEVEPPVRRRRGRPPRRPPLPKKANPTRRRDLVLLIGVVDTVRAQLESLPREVARELVNHLAERYR